MYQPLWRHLFPPDSKASEHVLIISVPEPTVGGGGGPPRSYLWPARRLWKEPQLLEKLLADSRTHGRHIYYRPAARYPAKKGGDSPGVMGSRCLWVDVDLDPEDDPEQALANIERYRPKPSYIFHSGRRGYHLIWCLDRLYTDLGKLQLHLSALCEQLKGDAAASRLKQGLRVPGSYHPKAPGFVPGSPGEAGLVRQVYPHPPEAAPAIYRLEEFPLPDNGLDDPAPPTTIKELFLRYFPEKAGHPGPWWTVHCPFHADATPSMGVNIEHGWFRCHADSCGVRGTLVELYRRMEGVPMSVAQKRLRHLQTPIHPVVALLEDYLRSLCTPLYRDTDHIYVRRHNTHHITALPLGSWARMEPAVSLVTDGAPATACQQIISDDISLQETQLYLKESVYQLGRGLPDSDTMTLLGQGVHILGDSEVLVVDGEHLYVADISDHDLELKRVERVPYRDTYLPIGCEDQNWVPWETIGPSDTYPHPPALYRRLRELLVRAWTFADSMDADYLALYTIYSVIYTAAPPPLQLQILGDTQTGKTALASGWFAGNAELPGMVPGAIYFSSGSAAGIAQTMNHTRRLMILDEIQDQNTRHAYDVIEAARNIESAGFRVVRGSRSGKPIVYDVMSPIVWASIRAPDHPADMNRRFPIQLPRRPGREHPSAILLREEGPEGLQLLRGQVFRAALLCYHQIRQGVGKPKSDPEHIRIVQRNRLLMQLAQLLHENPKKLIAYVAAKGAGLEEDIATGSPQEELRMALLYTPLPLAAWASQAERTTLAAAISRHRDLILPDAGVFYRADEGAVAVNPSRFRLYWNPFHWSAAAFTRQLKQLPAYIRQTRVWNDKVQIRASLLDASRLLADAEPSHVEVINDNGSPKAVDVPVNTDQSENVIGGALAAS